MPYLSEMVRSCDRSQGIASGAISSKYSSNPAGTEKMSILPSVVPACGRCNQASPSPNSLSGFEFGPHAPFEKLVVAFENKEDFILILMCMGRRATTGRRGLNECGGAAARHLAGDKNFNGLTEDVEGLCGAQELSFQKTRNGASLPGKHHSKSGKLVDCDKSHATAVHRSVPAHGRLRTSGRKDFPGDRRPSREHRNGATLRADATAKREEMPKRAAEEFKSRTRFPGSIPQGTNAQVNFAGFM